MTKNKYLFCDIGNSYIDFVLTDFARSIRTRAKTGSVLDMTLDELLQNDEGHINAYISSVNAVGLKMLRDALDKRKVPTECLNQNEMKAFANKNEYQISNIDILGQDLFCDLIATKDKTFRIIVDIGTATKILVITEENLFLGGSILPGPYAFLKAIYNDTDIKGEGILQSDTPLLSLKTEECLSSGAIFGTAGAIINIIKLILQKYKAKKPFIYLTGGGSILIKEKLNGLSDNDFIYDQNLTIKGLARAFEFEKYQQIN